MYNEIERKRSIAQWYFIEGKPLEWGGCVISESEGVETVEKKTKHGAHIIRKYENYKSYSYLRGIYIV